MTRIRQAYRFEQSLIPLETGYFKPLKDARERWDMETIWPDAPTGPHFRLLYHLHDGRYVLVDYLQCRRVSLRGFWNDQLIWQSDVPPIAWTATAEDAVLFLHEAQYPLPEALQPVFAKMQERIEAAREQRRPKTRELAHWAGRIYISDQDPQPAHLVDVLSKLKNIVTQGIRFIQHLGELKPGPVRWDRQSSRMFWASLYEHFPVDPVAWWGDPQIIPPARVGLADLKWPNSTYPLKSTLCELQALLDSSLACISPGRVTNNPDYPTEAESTAALERLTAILPEVEVLIVRIRLHMEAFERARDARAETPGAAPVPEPSTDDFQLWKLWKLDGRTQVQVAEYFTQLKKVPWDQSQVSRAVNRVKDWLAAGNQMPELSPVMPEKARPIDPRQLDQGARIDGRTPRQRRTRRSE